MADAVTGIAKDVPKEGKPGSSARRGGRRTQAPPPPTSDETERRMELAKAQPGVGGNLHATV